MWSARAEQAATVSYPTRSWYNDGVELSNVEIHPWQFVRMAESSRKVIKENKMKNDASDTTYLNLIGKK